MWGSLRLHLWQENNWLLFCEHPCFWPLNFSMPYSNPEREHHLIGSETGWTGQSEVIPADRSLFHHPTLSPYLLYTCFFLQVFQLWVHDANDETVLWESVGKQRRRQCPCGQAAWENGSGSSRGNGWVVGMGRSQRLGEQYKRADGRRCTSKRSSVSSSSTMIHMPIHATFEQTSTFELRRLRLLTPVTRKFNWHLPPCLPVHTLFGS